MPVPVKGEVLVKVEAASVNPVDWRAIQAGSMRVFGIPGKLPYVPGANVCLIAHMGHLVTRLIARRGGELET